MNVDTVTTYPFLLLLLYIHNVEMYQQQQQILGMIVNLTKLMMINIMLLNSNSVTSNSHLQKIWKV